MRRSLVLALAISAFAWFAPAPAFAQNYPSRQITLVVPFPPGSATDSVARRLADNMRQVTGETVIVENKPGADGNLAALSVLRSAPDGYTVFVTTNSTHAANVNLYNSLSYDPKNDFAPVAGIMTLYMMLTLKPESLVNSTTDFIALAKNRPQEKPLAFASGSTSSRGAAELFASRAGVTMQHVPYRGTPQALTDLIGGQVDTVFADTSAGLGLVRGRQLKAIAVTSPKRLPSLPDVPTIAESGVPGYEFGAWVGVFVRAKTPPEIITKLNKLVTDWVTDPETQKYMDTIGATPFPSTPEQLAAFAEADTKRWAEIVEVSKMEKK